MPKLYHLDVGCGDASIIISGSGYYLVDVHGIDRYAHLLPTSRRISAAIITHQHYDHFDGLRFLRDEHYAIDILIYSPYQRRHGDNSVELDEWNEFVSLRDHFACRGTKLYSPYRQTDWSKPYWTTNGLAFWMLGPDKSIAESNTRELHDASLVLLVKSLASEGSCLYAGDASDTSLKFIAERTTNFRGEMLKASHHGSINGADVDFVKACNPDYCVISTAHGVHDNVPHPTALRRYEAYTRKKVYRTDVVGGMIEWTF